jgi:hypothetical protein
VIRNSMKRDRYCHIERPAPEKKGETAKLCYSHKSANKE